jgi:hypothetical protein
MLKKIIIILSILVLSIWSYFLYKTYFLKDNIVKTEVETITPKENNSGEGVNPAPKNDILDFKYKSTWEVWGWDTY